MQTLLEELNNSFTEFKRTVHFFSKCGNTEESHIKNLKLEYYYHCGQCHDYHMISKVT